MDSTPAPVVPRELPPRMNHEPDSKAELLNAPDHPEDSSIGLLEEWRKTATAIFLEAI